MPSDTYHLSHIWTNHPEEFEPNESVIGSGPVLLRQETNDDNDDGLPDGYTEVWYLRFKTLKDCYIHLCGGLKDRVPYSHLGYFNQPVTTIQDGVELIK